MKLAAWWDALPPQTKRELSAKVQLTDSYLANILRTSPGKLKLSQAIKVIEFARDRGVELLVGDFLNEVH